VTICKLPSRRFRAELKSGRAYVAGRTFDTKREAQAWPIRERAALAVGVDPRAGKATVRALLPVWLEERKHVGVTGLATIIRSRTAQAKNDDNESRKRRTDDSARPERETATNARDTSRSDTAAIDKAASAIGVSRGRAASAT
jgi:hypothetical protein